VDTIMGSRERDTILESLLAARDAGGEPSVEEDRRGWEKAAQDVNRGLDVTVTPLDLDGVPAELVSNGPPTDPAVILLLHGGGYNCGSPRTHRALAAALARTTAMAVLLPDYRLAPEHPCPAAVDDTVASYRWLLNHGWSRDRIAIGGDSAGGGLAVAALVRLRDEGVALPAAAFVLSPWVDLTLAGDSMVTHASLDPLTTEADLRHAAGLYLAGLAPADPRASPLFADLSDLPPLLVQVGGLEILRSDATRLAEKVDAAGGEARLEIWDGLWHVFHFWEAELPEARQAFGQIATFLRARPGSAPAAAALRSIGG
jgi:epsilon-lactone hydrolase